MSQAVEKEFWCFWQIVDRGHVRWVSFLCGFRTPKPLENRVQYLQTVHDNKVAHAGSTLCGE